MSAPGLLKASELTKVQGSLVLSTKTARAWKALQAAARSKLGRSIAIAGPAGAYRSAAVQDAMHAAGKGSSRAAKVRWGLNPNSSVSIAAHPGGSHEKGTRVDIVGTAMDGPFLALAARFGFTREFGPADPNHFMHDGRTATAAVSVAAVRPAKKRITYKVKPGDTYTSIAALYSDPREKKDDLTVDDLVRLNPKVNPRALRIGQPIYVS